MSGNLRPLNATEARSVWRAFDAIWPDDKPWELRERQCKRCGRWFVYQANQPGAVYLCRNCVDNKQGNLATKQMESNNVRPDSESGTL